MKSLRLLNWRYAHRAPDWLRDLLFRSCWWAYDYVPCGKNYYYCSGPLLPLAKFCCITEAIEHEPERWQKGGLLPSGHDHGGHAVLYFSFWKIREQAPRYPSPAELDWYWGFCAVAERRG